jgi:toluene monooxygenase electron transfer component
MRSNDAVCEGRGGRVRLEPDGRGFHCAPGQTVLAAALAAGIDLPYECASGSCGSCRARLVTGAVASLWADAPGLSERDRRKGDRILCCQSVAQGECVIESRPGNAPPPRLPALRHAQVSSLRPLNHDVVHLVLDARTGIEFLPGQFMVFDLGSRIGRRAYSMSNLPEGRGRLEMIV